MPKIEVNEKNFFALLGKKYDYDTLETKLPCAKAELDEKPDASKPEDERVIKIELNDTNRPDLWSTVGVARQIALHDGAKHADYQKFMSAPDAIKDPDNRIVTVDAELQHIRPYIVAFVISGKAIDEAMLKDIIQTQEKLAWNFGRKRKTISMGVYYQGHSGRGRNGTDCQAKRVAHLQCHAQALGGGVKLCVVGEEPTPMEELRADCACAASR